VKKSADFWKKRKNQRTLDRLDILNKHKSAMVDALTSLKRKTKKSAEDEARTLRLLRSFPL
jgi:hypothetical protein